MTQEVIMSGFGGQGVMVMGQLITYAGMLENKHVTWIPSYGPEMRGGTANCSVIVSDEEIRSPVIEQADAGIVLNQPSYEKFLPKIKPGGVLIVNSSIIDTKTGRDDIKIIAIPAGEIANELGKANLANMVCLGALLPALQLVNRNSVDKAIHSVVGKKKPEMLAINMAAVQKGMDFKQ
jgi:2-oxoglutarate ferredoxin oxidoreductase subunit gamma